jgi:CRP-like cAMP-binding protein
MSEASDTGPDLQIFVDRLCSRSVLTDEEKQAILDLPHRVAHIKTNRDFVKLGESTDHACFLLSGLIGRFGQNSEGERQITAIHIPGDMPNLYSVVQPESLSALQALSVATILRIPHQAIREVAARYPAVAEALWRDCAVDAAILSQWVVNVGRRDAKCRLAHLLCEMATRLEAVDDGKEAHFAFAATQAHLADATGLTTVHVNRTIKSLREAGLADVRAGRVDIFDWPGLMAAGDFDADYLQRDTEPEERLRIAPVP